MSLELDKTFHFKLTAIFPVGTELSKYTFSNELWCPLLNVPCLEDITYFGEWRSGTPTFSWLLHYCKTWSEILWYMSPEEKKYWTSIVLWIVDNWIQLHSECIEQKKNSLGSVCVSLRIPPEFHLLQSLSFTVFSGCSPPPASSTLLLISMTKPAPRERHEEGLPQTLKFQVKSPFLLVWLWV